MAIDRTGGLNSGLPDHDGLDEGTKASLQRQLDDRSAIKVGSFRDLQTGESDKPVAERPTNPTQDDSVLKDITEHVAEEEGGVAAGPVGEDWESYTVEELKDELANRDLPVSGTKDELIARLEGNE